MTMQEQLRALVERHHVNLVEQISTVRQLLTPPDSSGALPAVRVVEAESIMHQMKGTAGSMGFPDIGAAATALDETLKTLKKLPGPIAPAQLELPLNQLATLQRITESTTPAMSKLYDADLSSLARRA
jgi:HPt (histidine-containing phosphotransfer) domain-containing protein